MNNNQPSPEKLETLYPERSYADLARMYPWANQTYYQLSEDEKMYRTVYPKINPFMNNKIQVMMSNFVTGIPPEGMKELNPQLMKAIGRTGHLANAPF